MKRLILILLLLPSLVFAGRSIIPDLGTGEVINGSMSTTITSPISSGGNLEVEIQDQHSRILELKFIRALNVPPFYNLTAPIAVGNTTISVDDTTLMVTGGVLAVVNPDGTYYLGGILSIVTDTSVTVDTPADQALIVLDSSVIVATDELTSLAGTLTSPVIYQIAGVGAATGIDIDITRVMGIIQDDDAMNDSLFGGGPALDNGTVLRHHNGFMTNLWNIKTNGDIALICFDANYHETGPAASQYSLRFRNTFAGRAKHGVTIRLEAGDTLELLIQDSIAVESFKMMAQGHFVSN